MSRNEDRPASQTISSGHFLRLARLGAWEFVERVRSRGVVAVLALTAEDEIVLTQQYRPPVQNRVIDLPAGLAGDIPGAEQEALSVAARRELEEETGFTATSLQRLAMLPSSAGLTSEVVTLFVADRVHRIGAGGGDAGEQITVHIVPRVSIASWLAERVTSGSLVDPKVYAALWWAERLGQN